MVGGATCLGEYLCVGTQNRGGFLMSLHHDVLAELELTMVPSLRPQPAAGMWVQAGEGAEAGTGCGSSRRSFWCALKDQEVEVEFGMKRLLGFPRLAGVKRCS